MKEEWKNIEGFENLYQISNLGRFKSFKNKKEKILKPADAMGYEIIRLFKEKKIYTLKSHRLVAYHFIDNPQNKPEVNHKNGNKKDNTILNLEWMTRSENMKHAVLTGLKGIKKGVDNGNCKLNESEVRQIKNELNHLTCSQLSKIFKVSRAAIHLIKNNTNWKHI